jgi:hypothetical protein
MRLAAGALAKLDAILGCYPQRKSGFRAHF